jgi:hypothetical protein
MATVLAVVNPKPKRQDMAAVYSVTWGPITTTNNVGAPINLSNFADRTIQVNGTFGASGTIVIEGSNDPYFNADGVTLATPTNFYTLNDPFNNALSITTASLKGVIEAPLWIRPRLSSGGDGTTSITINLFGRGSFRP